MQSHPLYIHIYINLFLNFFRILIQIILNRDETWKDTRTSGQDGSNGKLQSTRSSQLDTVYRST